MMKSVCVTLLCLATTLIFSQEMPVGTKDYIAPSPEKTTELSFRYPNAIDMIINGVSVDKRVLQYYNSEDVSEMSAEKIKTITSIYVSSYQLVTPKNILSEKCLNYIEKELNLGLYNNQRMKSKRKEVVVNYDTCQFKIALFSWDEINNSK